MKNLLYILAILLAFSACEPAEEILTKDPNAMLTFETDTVLFDTVFSTITTATRRVRVYNPNKNAILINNVRFGGGATSPFAAIVNGQKSTELRDLTIRGGDSILVILEATIDPADENLPYIVADSLIFNANNTESKVQIRAWGQDAIFLNDTILECNAVWDSTRPYVLYNAIQVDTNCTLTIKEGTRIYANNNALLVVDGQLNIEGTIEHPVRIEGMRREKYYENTPGQWLAIFLRDGSRNNKINHAIIKNAFRGIQVGEPRQLTGADLELSNSMILNMSESGLFCINPNKVLVYNNVIANCADFSVIGYLGGNYEFYHNTFSFSNTLAFNRKNPSVIFSNADVLDNTNMSVNPIDLNFINNIVNGRLEKEFALVFAESNQIALSLRYNFIKTSDTTFNVNNNIISQQEIRLKLPRDYDFRLDTSNVSVAKDAGMQLNLPGITIDLDGKPRPSGSAPDMGAYEQQD